jgi:hypothetical protein
MLSQVCYLLIIPTYCSSDSHFLSAIINNMPLFKLTRLMARINI